MKYAFLSILMVFGTSAFAAETRVEGRIYSSNNCGYFTTNLGDFRATYNNRELAWGSRVVLHLAFHDQVNKTSWTKASELEMSATEAYTWQVEAKQLTVASRGEYYADEIQYVFEIIRP